MEAKPGKQGRQKAVALSRDEWDFHEERVPDSELKACLFYEYARESQSIRRIIEGPFPRPNEVCVSEFCGLRDNVRLYAPHVLISADTRRKRLVKPWLAKKPAKMTLAKPWQAKTRANREVIVAEIAELRPPASECVLKPLERISCLADHGIWSPQTRCVNINKEFGIERILIQIHRGDFTDTEMLDYLREWIPANRPAGIGRHNEKGRGPSDLRAHLDWLGVMRLLAAYPLREAMDRVNDAGRSLGASESDWRKKKSSALAHFHELFHFLPKEENPLSAAPFKARSKHTAK